MTFARKRQRVNWGQAREAHMRVQSRIQRRLQTWDSINNKNSFESLSCLPSQQVSSGVKTLGFGPTISAKPLISLQRRRQFISPWRVSSSTDSIKMLIKLRVHKKNTTNEPMRARSQCPHHPAAAVISKAKVPWEDVIWGF
ncbi:hypothetical protein QQF64_026720 [Cirrhinus molitorella]|uniref:Uncharacterized protein n=1 Tax=Cirrhinus molitorella TaxID=172907 RepID=A0ABR3NAZ8_9TELE